MRHTSILLVLLGWLSNRGICWEELYTDNGLYRGAWGNIDECSEGSTFAMEFKYEREGHLDETAGNSIKLFCHDEEGQIGGYITSTEGYYGDWQGIRNCPFGTNITGFRIRVLSDQGTFGDDIGVDNVQVKCSDGTILDGMEGVIELGEEYDDPDYVDEEDDDVTTEWIERNGKKVEVLRAHKDSKDVNIYGNWGSWAECSWGVVVAIQTRVEPTNPINDDAGLCDVTMFCM